MTSGSSRWLVGTSGWMYSSWRPSFYPEGLGQPRWLARYAEEFPVVEVNATFYRLARETAAQRWADVTPAGFRFVVKGSRFLTHSRKLGDVDTGIGRFFAPLAPLAGKLTAVLWQLPPWMTVDADLLARFLDAAAADPVGSRIQHAVEFRHPSWQIDPVYDMLDSRNAMTVNVSGPQLPDDRVVTGGRAYVRFHGLTNGYRHDYSDEQLASWAQHIARQPAALAFFNNDAGGRAVKNARQLVRLLAEMGERLEERKQAEQRHHRTGALGQGSHRQRPAARGHVAAQREQLAHTARVDERDAR